MEFFVKIRKSYKYIKMTYKRYKYDYNKIHRKCDRLENLAYMILDPVFKNNIIITNYLI